MTNCPHCSGEMELGYAPNPQPGEYPGLLLIWWCRDCGRARPALMPTALTTVTLCSCLENDPDPIRLEDGRLGWRCRACGHECPVAARELDAWEEAELNPTRRAAGLKMYELPA